MYQMLRNMAQMAPTKAIINLGPNGEWIDIPLEPNLETEKRVMVVTFEDGSTSHLTVPMDPKTTLEQVTAVLEILFESAPRVIHVGPKDPGLTSLKLTEYIKTRLARVAPGLEGREILDRTDIRISEGVAPYTQNSPLEASNELILFDDISVLRFKNGALPPSKTAYQVGQKTADLIAAHYPLGAQVLELGTGSGVIALKMAHDLKDKACVTATDIRSECLAIAEASRAINSISPEALKFKQGNWIEAVPYGKFDIIVSNPPFLPAFLAEERKRITPETNHLTALDGGLMGLEFYEKTLLAASEKLNPGGRLVFQVQPRAAAVVRVMAQQILGRKFKSSTVHSANKEKKQSQARGFMVVIETH